MNAVFIKEMKDADVKKKTKVPRKIKKKGIVSEDEEYNMSDCGYGEEEKEDPINTNLAYCVKAEVEELSGDDFNYQEYESDESEEITEQSKKPKTRKYHTRQSSSRKISNKKCWGSLNKRAKVKKPKRFNCTKNCKQNCKTKIEKQWRQDLCAEFWNLNRIERKNYVSKFVEKRPVLRRKIIRTNRSSRGYTNRYFLKNRSDEKIRVCMGFFLSTLSISGHSVKSAMEDSRTADESIDGKINSVHKEQVDCPQGETVDKGIGNVVESNNEMKNEIIEKRSAPEAGTNTNLETDKEIDVQVAVTKELNVSQRPSSSKPPRSSTKRKTKDKKVRLPKPVKCNDACQMKCTGHISEEQRAQICATYWSMDYKRRKDFLLSRIETRDVLTTKNEEYRKGNRAKRTYTNRFYFRSGRGENVRVCSNFFMSTLGIGRLTIDNAIRNADQTTGSYIGEDKRGKHAPGNKIPEDMVNEVRRHIESYPTWVPHKSYKTRFLHSSLNIRKMYREYKQICIDQERKFVSSNYFINVFHKEFRLAFLKPASKPATKLALKKKDSAGDVVTFKKLNPNISEFTGEEGGFWIPSEVAVDHIGNQCPQIVVETCDRNRINIQQNLQLQAPHCVQQTPFLDVVNAIQCSTSTNYLHLQDGKPEQQQQTQNVMASYTNAAYAQDPSVFRIL